MNKNIFYGINEQIETETATVGGKSVYPGHENIEVSDSLFMSDFNPSTNTQEINDRLLKVMSKKYSNQSDYYPMKGGGGGVETELETDTESNNYNMSSAFEQGSEEFQETITSDSMVLPRFMNYSEVYSGSNRNYENSYSSNKLNSNYSHSVLESNSIFDISSNNYSDSNKFNKEYSDESSISSTTPSIEEPNVQESNSSFNYFEDNIRINKYNKTESSQTQSPISSSSHAKGYRLRQ